MNVAIISITKQGKEISDKIAQKLQQDPQIIHIKQYHKNVKNAIDECFNTYDAIIAIMASGIIIRSIAPYVTSKLSDPAVVLVDDNANHAISLLSGHFGGANPLTHKIADLLGADAVITTSTDVNKKTGIDSIAQNYYFNLEKPENIRYINRALVDDRLVDLRMPEKYSYIIDDETQKSYNITYTDEIDEKIVATVDGHDVILTPRRVVMGIGARRDIAQAKVENAVKCACEILNIKPQRIDSFATVDVKENEKGILDTVAMYDKPLKIITKDEIKNFTDNECSKSDFVMKQFGIKGVCEPTALLANNENSHLIFKKTAYNGVTIAVSLSDK